MAKTAKAGITADVDLETVKLGDFVTFTFDGNAGGPLWFRVVGPGSTTSSRVGVEGHGQIQVQQYGDFEVAFTDGEKDLASTKFSIKPAEG